MEVDDDILLSVTLLPVGVAATFLHLLAVVGEGDGAAGGSGDSAAAAQPAGASTASDARGSGVVAEAGGSSVRGSADAGSGNGDRSGGSDSRSAADGANGQPGAATDVAQFALLATARLAGPLAQLVLCTLESGKLHLSQPHAQGALNELAKAAAALRTPPLWQLVQQCAGERWPAGGWLGVGEGAAMRLAFLVVGCAAAVS